MESKLLPDNQELTSKELDDRLRDKLMVGKIVFSPIDNNRFIHNPANVADYLNPENKLLREQLTATQQALELAYKLIKWNKFLYDNAVYDNDEIKYHEFVAEELKMALTQIKGTENA